ncbi:hypothetical protein D8770_24610 [Methylobacterium sp. DB1607]|nr:hypothetical protein [Methylobacterium sp. DB1607]
MLGDGCPLRIMRTPMPIDPNPLSGTHLRLTPTHGESDRPYAVRRRSRTDQIPDDVVLGPTFAAPAPDAKPEHVVRPERRGRHRKPIWQRLPDLIRGTEVRKVRRRGHTGYTGEVPMTRLRGKVLSAESCLETDFLIITDAQDDDIVDMTAHPLTLTIISEGRPYSWTPDFRIVRSTGVRELVEVKPLTKVRPIDPAKRAKAAARLEACRAAARAAGYTFRLVTEQEIRVQPLLYNAKLIHRHMHGYACRHSIMKAILALPDLSPSATVTALGSALNEPIAALAIAVRLDRLGHIRLDRGGPLSRSTTFTVLQADAGEGP